MEYSEDTRQHVKWEIEAIKSCSETAKKTIENKEIKDLENKLKSL